MWTQMTLKFCARETKETKKWLNVKDAFIGFYEKDMVLNEYFQVRFSPDSILVKIGPTKPKMPV